MSEPAHPQPSQAGGARRTALHGVHRDLGAKMVDFGGWEMPLAYGEGTIAEHRACRTDAVVFDISHLGTVRLEGANAFDTLQTTLTNDLRRIGPGRAQYTHLLDPTDASVIDDIIVWWSEETAFDVMPNASNTRPVIEAIGGWDVTDERCVVAVQGPAVRRRLAALLPDAVQVERFGVVPFDWRGTPGTAAGTGYTGEDGLELSIPNEAAESLWRAVLSAGVVPAGLGARDTLRLEAGLPLHGQELGAGISPLQAGLAWVIGWDKGEFRGRAALEAERQHGVARRIVGLLTTGRRPLRQGAEVVVDGNRIGTVTSGNFSPMLERGIGLALVDSGVELPVGTSVELRLRDKTVLADIAPLPFVAPGQWASDRSD